MAKAIAAAEAAKKKEKAAENEKAERDKPTFSRTAGASMSPRKPTAPAATSTKRIKSGDG